MLFRVLAQKVNGLYPLVVLVTLLVVPVLVHQWLMDHMFTGMDLLDDQVVINHIPEVLADQECISSSIILQQVCLVASTATEILKDISDQIFTPCSWTGPCSKAIHF